MTPAELLRRARALIERPEGWTKGELARDSVGRWVGPWSDDAACWCSTGAINRAAINITDPREAGIAVATAMWWLKGAIGSIWIAPWNDAATHADVLAAFDRAIALAEEAGE